MVLPADRLVPMVPQRLNYIHWLEDLLAEGRREKDGERGRVLGIDIGGCVFQELCVCVCSQKATAGTGASCVYPLLGVTVNNWHFLATETDQVSVQSALNNVTRNNLQSKITGTHKNLGVSAHTARP